MRPTPRHTVRLTMHEKAVIALYRCLNEADRRLVEGVSARALQLRSDDPRLERAFTQMRLDRARGSLLADFCRSLRAVNQSEAPIGGAR